MAPLINPGLPSEHPLQMYHDNVMAGQSVTWYSDEANPRELIDYVLSLLQVDFADLLFDEMGFARSRDMLVFLTALVSERGSALTVWGFGDAGAVVLNRAIRGEWAKMMDELERGEYGGNPVGARSEALFSGRPQEDSSDSGVFDFINGAEIISVFEAVFLDLGAKPE